MIRAIENQLIDTGVLPAGMMVTEMPSEADVVVSVMHSRLVGRTSLVYTFRSRGGDAQTYSRTMTSGKAEPTTLATQLSDDVREYCIGNDPFPKAEPPPVSLQPGPAPPLRLQARTPLPPDERVRLLRGLRTLRVISRSSQLSSGTVVDTLRNSPALRGAGIKVVSGAADGTLEIQHLDAGSLVWSYVLSESRSGDALAWGQVAALRGKRAGQVVAHRIVAVLVPAAPPDPDRAELLDALDRTFREMPQFPAKIITSEVTADEAESVTVVSEGGALVGYGQNSMQLRFSIPLSAVEDLDLTSAAHTPVADAWLAPMQLPDDQIPTPADYPSFVSLVAWTAVGGALKVIRTHTHYLDIAWRRGDRIEVLTLELPKEGYTVLQKTFRQSRLVAAGK